MFYPYFRGRQFELLAINEALPRLKNKRKICPIIEPVAKSFSGLTRLMTVMKGTIPHIVVVNPSVGAFKSKPKDVAKALMPFLQKGGDFIPGLLVLERTTLTHISTFLNAYPDNRTALIFNHEGQGLSALAKQLKGLPIKPVLVFLSGEVSHAFVQSFSGLEKVLLQDCFRKRRSNKEYPDLEFFSDLHQRYKAEGFDGFGDFSIVGRDFSEGGGAAYAVAIHLTELKGKARIDVHHFLSDRTEGTADVAGKFMEALKKLVAHVRSNPANFVYSTGCVDFQDLLRRRHYPGLGFVKKLSMRHHLELIETLL